MKKILILAIAFILMFGLNNALAGKGNGKNTPKGSDSCKTITSGELLNSSDEIITTGYDEWGYNYQARIFNGYYCDAYQDASWCQAWKDVELKMKWNDAWLSNKDCDGDGKLDRHYGHDSYIGSGAWITNHMSGEYQGEKYSWNVSGNWMLDFAGGVNNREFRNLVQDIEGNVTGEFWFLSGGEWKYGGALIGTISGDILQLYYDRSPIDYTGYFEGTISENAIINGTFSDSKGNNLSWTAVGISQKIYEMCEWTYFTKIVAVPEDAVSEDGYWHTIDGEEIGPIIWGQFAVIFETEENTCEDPYIYKGFRPGLGNW